MNAFKSETTKVASAAGSMVLSTSFSKEDQPNVSKKAIEETVLVKEITNEDDSDSGVKQEDTVYSNELPKDEEPKK